MGQRDYVFISVPQIPEIRDEGEDFWRDPADRGEAVLPGPNETEDLESVLLENLNLNTIREQPSTGQLRRLVQPQLYREPSQRYDHECQLPDATNFTAPDVLRVKNRVL